VTATLALAAPPFCPNPACAYHRAPSAQWRWSRAGFFSRRAAPQRIQRFQCCHCRRHFSTQTFSTTYWLKRPALLPRIFHPLVACAGLRQIARQFAVSPQTVLGQAARLARHCLLFHQCHRPQGPVTEPLVLDGFESFEHSHYHPTRFHVVAGQTSHYFYGFTASELRRSGRMTGAQRRRRTELEQRVGRPDPRSTEVEVAAVLGLLAPTRQKLELHSDEHTDYPRALARLPHLEVTHRTISAHAARTPMNPLWAINLLDLLLRHSGANHKRETIAHSKRRQSAIERMFVFLVWRNHLKWFSEQRHDQTPAMRLGLEQRRLGLREVLGERLFPSRIALPQAWQRYYWRQVRTRVFARNAEHRLRYAA
jgi:transposase-like protein